MAQSALQKKTRTKTKTKTKTRLALKKRTKLPKRKAKKSKVIQKTKTKKKLALVARKLTSITQTSYVGVGDLAPNFILTDQHGSFASLSDYRGKKVVLYFYPKDDTPGCTKEACSFRDHLPKFDGVDAVILGVSFDDQTSHQKFIEKHQLNFRLLSDLKKEVANAYGCYVDKNMYGHISKGIERSTFVIDCEGRIVGAFRKVSVDGHTQEVLDTLLRINSCSS